MPPNTKFNKVVKNSTTTSFLSIFLSSSSFLLLLLLLLLIQNSTRLSKIAPQPPPPPFFLFFFFFKLRTNSPSKDPQEKSHVYPSNLQANNPCPPQQITTIHNTFHKQIQNPRPHSFIGKKTGRDTTTMK